MKTIEQIKNIKSSDKSKADLRKAKEAAALKKAKEAAALKKAKEAAALKKAKEAAATEKGIQDLKKFLENDKNFEGWPRTYEKKKASVNDYEQDSIHSSMQFVYLGRMYDKLGRQLNNTDKKIGFSCKPLCREQTLNRTKSPIGYEIISMFEVDDMRKVERLFHTILASRRVQGEWFEDSKDCLTMEFNNFLLAYGAKPHIVSNFREKDESVFQNEDELSSMLDEFLT